MHHFQSSVSPVALGLNHSPAYTFVLVALRIFWSHFKFAYVQPIGAETLIRSGSFRVFVLVFDLISVSSFLYSKCHFPTNTSISVSWDNFSSEGLVAKLFQTLVSSILRTVIFTATRTSHFAMFCRFPLLIGLVLELALFYQSSETIMQTWTKEIAAIGQATVDQNVPHSTNRRLWNNFFFTREYNIWKFERNFKLHHILKFIIMICRQVLSCHVFHHGTGIAQSVYQLATGWTVRGSNPGEDRIFCNRPDRPWGPPSHLYNGYRVFPGGGKSAWVWRWTPPSSSAEAEGRVELYNCSPSWPSWPVLGRTLPFTFTCISSSSFTLSL